MLKLLTEVRAMKNQGLVDIKIKNEDFILHQKGANEATSSSVLGINFRHYKSAVISPHMDEIHTLFANIAAAFGCNV